MSANRITPDLIRLHLRSAMRDLRQRVNDAAVFGGRPASMSVPNWKQGQISMLWLLFGGDPLLPQDLTDELYAAHTEADWLMSGCYPEHQPCAWPN